MVVNCAVIKLCPVYECKTNLPCVLFISSTIITCKTRLHMTRLQDFALTALNASESQNWLIIVKSVVGICPFVSVMTDLSVSLNWL